MSDDARLSARIEALEAQVTALRRELHELRGGRAASMAGDARCPACGSRRLLHALEIGGPHDPATRLALSQPSLWSSRRVGNLQAYICSGCRLMEWYVDDLTDVDADGQRVVLIDGEDEAGHGPYR
jgi:hypothetical protein